VFEWLSEAWFEELRQVASAGPERPGASARVQFVLVGGPKGEVCYFWVVEDGRIAECGLGALDDVELTLTESWDDALATQRGELDPSAAFMQGRIKVTGSMTRLLALLPLLSSAEHRSAMAALNERTALPG
jgi:hypothetical protein